MINWPQTIIEGLILICVIVFLLRIVSEKVEIKSIFKRIPILAIIGTFLGLVAINIGLVYFEYKSQLPVYSINENLEYSAGSTIPVEDLVELENESAYSGYKYATIHSVVWNDTDTCENLTFDYHTLTIDSNAKSGDVIKVRLEVMGAKLTTQVRYPEIAYITVK